MKILTEIIQAKKTEVRHLKKRPSAIRPAARQVPVLDFSQALLKYRPAVIGEIKFRSPSQGLIRKSRDPGRLARSIERHGAAAISVLTDYQFFGGRLDYLNQVKAAVRIPVLRKDFILDPVQIDQTYVRGADAVLLIKRLLSRRRLIQLLNYCQPLGLSCLVEVHNEKELDEVLDTPAKIIGVNNRNLATMKIDLRTSLRLIHKIPDRCLAISESGINGPAEIKQLMEAGFDAVLVGTLLMASSKPGVCLRRLTAIQYHQ